MTTLAEQLEALNALTPEAEPEAEPGNPLAILVHTFTEWVHEKAGARNSAKDAERLQSAHDLLVENGATCTLKVYKGADGKLRWATFSSTAFQDRDKEIVSTKALNDDVARADAAKEYGPLRWWHVEGLDFGPCDYNAMSGKVLIESGTFYDETIGAKIKEAANDLAVSIGFQHPPNEPDAAGVFHSIRRFERSLLPADKASNLFTQLTVAKENDMSLLKEKFDELVKLIGQGPAEALAAKAEQTEKAAEAAGVAFKETPALVVTEKLGQSAGSREREIAAFARMDEEGGRETDKQFTEYVKKCMKEHIDAVTDIGTRFGAHEKSHKEAHEKEATELQTAEKARADQVALLTETVKALASQVADLQGETPRAAKGYRATQEGPIRTEQPGSGPQPNDSFKDFMSFVTTGKS